MTDPIRAALERLIDRLDETTDPNGPVPAWSDSFYAARAALAQPAPPAEREVGQLVALIRQIALAWEPDACLLGNMTAGQLARAADLLEQRHPAPVPVSERLPGPEDCALWPGEPDETPWCWVFTKGPVDDDSWERRPFICLTSNRLTHSHWLPAHALPLPAGEMKP